MTEDQAVLDSIEYLLRLSNKNIIETDFFAELPLTATVLPHCQRRYSRLNGNARSTRI